MKTRLCELILVSEIQLDQLSNIGHKFLSSLLVLSWSAAAEQQDVNQNGKSKRLTALSNEAEF